MIPFCSSLRSQAKIVFIKLLNIVRIRNIARIDSAFFIFYDYVNGD